MQPPALMTYVIVEHTDDAPFRAARELAQEPLGGVRSPKNENRLSFARDKGLEPVLLPASIGKTATAHERDEQYRMEDENRTRDRHMEHEHQRRRGDRTEQHDHHDALQVGQARRNARYPIQAEGEKQDDIKRHHENDRVPPSSR